jgi:hypothetical protein
VVFFVLRCAAVVLACWVLWKLLLALFPARQPPRRQEQDEWTEVLEEIKELPETTDPRPGADDARRPRQL